jgi:hypothetical protein
VRDHHVRCKGAPHNGSPMCTCPPQCINCKRANKVGKGHTAISTSCPLRKLYRTANTHTGDSPEEGPVITRMVEDPEPSSQPTLDGVPPLSPKTPARVDDTPPPATTTQCITDFREFALSKGITDDATATAHPTLFQDFVTHLSSLLATIPANHSTPTPPQ